MRFISILLCAALTASVSHGQDVPASDVPITDENGVCQNDSAAADDESCISNYSLSNAAQEDTIDVVIHALLKISDFVYSFANVRRIVKANEGKTRKKSTGWFSSEKYTVAFDTPALILTQDGAQEKSKHKLFKYVVTPDAIKLFMEKNRKWFDEPEGGGTWEFDKTVTEKTKPFLLEATVDEATRVDMKIVDYVSDVTNGKQTCCYLWDLSIKICSISTHVHLLSFSTHFALLYRMMSSPPKAAVLFMALLSTLHESGSLLFSVVP